MSLARESGSSVQKHGTVGVLGTIALHPSVPHKIQIMSVIGQGESYPHHHMTFSFETIWIGPFSFT